MNTIPPKTLTSLVDHGKGLPETIERGLAKMQAAFAFLMQAGINLDDITEAHPNITKYARKGRSYEVPGAPGHAARSGPAQ